MKVKKTLVLMLSGAVFTISGAIASTTNAHSKVSSDSRQLAEKKSAKRQSSQQVDDSRKERENRLKDDSFDFRRRVQHE